MRINKSFVSLAIIGLLFFVFVCRNASAGDRVPTYRGFPVYPPQEVGKLSDQNLSRFSFEIVSPQKIKDIYKRYGLPLFPDKSWTTEQKNKWAESKKEMKREEKTVLSGFDKAKDYILRQTNNLGWSIIDQDSYDDGGSKSYGFAKRMPNGILEVSVTFWTGMMLMELDEGVPSFSPPDDWGKIEYQFKDKL